MLRHSQIIHSSEQSGVADRLRAVVHTSPSEIQRERSHTRGLEEMILDDIHKYYVVFCICDCLFTDSFQEESRKIYKMIVIIKSVEG